MTAPWHLLGSQAMEFITSQFPKLEELIVTHQAWDPMDFFMDSRLHTLYKFLLNRGVNVLATADG